MDLNEENRWLLRRIGPKLSLNAIRIKQYFLHDLRQNSRECTAGNNSYRAGIHLMESDVVDPAGCLSPDDIRGLFRNEQRYSAWPCGLPDAPLHTALRIHLMRATTG